MPAFLSGLYFLAQPIDQLALYAEPSAAHTGWRLPRWLELAVCSHCLHLRKKPMRPSI
ncbi:MAG: hypothetical protein HPY59_01855 [Anaerolineae bacterium]|nr:hypothetical protein [Anaerolineae bacterium]